MTRSLSLCLCTCLCVCTPVRARLHLGRMCGLDVDADDGSSGEEDKDECVWVGDGVKMLPPPVAHSGGSSVWGSRRGRCGCLAHGALLLLWNLCVVSAGTALLALVFTAVLSPALLLLYVGFLCHSRVSHSVHGSPVRC